MRSVAMNSMRPSTLYTSRTLPRRVQFDAGQFGFQNDGSWIGDHVVFRLSIGGVFPNILRCARKSISIATEEF